MAGALSSARVKALEGEFRKELRQLKEEVEGGKWLGGITPPPAHTVNISLDEKTYKQSRVDEMADVNSVSEAHPLVVQADRLREAEEVRPSLTPTRDYPIFRCCLLLPLPAVISPAVVSTPGRRRGWPSTALRLWWC